MTRLSSEALRSLTDNDHQDHEALLAVDPEGRAVGVARYVRSTDGIGEHLREMLRGAAGGDLAVRLPRRV